MEEQQQARVVAYGVDTLVVNAFYPGYNGKPLKRELDEQLALQLDEWKQQAQATHEEYATSWVFNGSVLHMCPNGGGRGQWPWMLKSRDLTLYVSRGKWNGAATIRLSSEYLWSSPSLLKAIIAVQVLVDGIFGDEMCLQLSEVHLCADIAGWSDSDTLDRHQNFVSRSRKRAKYAEPDWGYGGSVREYSYGLQATGFDFSRGSAISATIYDKTREIEQSGKLWFEDVWAAFGRWAYREQVYRVEIRWKREALHELRQEVEGMEVFHGIEDVYELPDRLPLLWAYGVGVPGAADDDELGGWLRCVRVGEGVRRSRWPVHPVWEVVQGAFSEGVQLPEHFGKVVRKRWEDRNIDKGIEAVMGYLTSLAAWARDDLPDEGIDLSVVLHWLAMKGEKYLERVERDFAEEVQRKRLRFGTSGEREAIA